VQELVRSEPTLLLYQGRFLDDAMRQERMTREEISAALRGSGVSKPENVAAVVLESDGSVSVVRHVQPGARTADASSSAKLGTRQDAKANDPDI
jgi:uncharacterized membrane protein YcaP (DUF421 family)